jgi:hypothetical protein
MALRYHKKVYTKPQDLEKLKTLTNTLNGMRWTHSEHCLDNVKYRIIDIEAILRFIKGIILEPEQIFEYYLDDKSREPEKICYRINYNGDIDLILVVSKAKNLITIYINSKDDGHETLKKELYCKG